MARDWFARFEGAGLDGVVAKRADLPYREGERVMMKVKHERTADCVVAGFRWHKSGGVVGSLLLGLYDDDGVLHHVGVTASFTMARRRELVDEIAPYRRPSLDGHPWAGLGGGRSEAPARTPGAPSRWNASKDLAWEPLAPDLVCEVAYDHLQGDRFRHATTFRRWRPDRQPRVVHLRASSRRSCPRSWRRSSGPERRTNRVASATGSGSGGADAGPAPPAGARPLLGEVRWPGRVPQSLGLVASAVPAARPVAVDARRWPRRDHPVA